MTDERHKLEPLLEYVDYSKSINENTEKLMIMADSLHIQTTKSSISQLLYNKQREHNIEMIKIPLALARLIIAEPEDLISSNNYNEIQQIAKESLKIWILTNGNSQT